MGTFVKFKAQGQGKYISQNGKVYIGEWLEDLQHGNGREILPDGGSFDGEFNSGLK
jgi:hypothetical protein